MPTLRWGGTEVLLATNRCEETQCLPLARKAAVEQTTECVFVAGFLHAPRDKIFGLVGHHPKWSQINPAH